MTATIAKKLLENGLSHGFSGLLLYNAARNHGSHDLGLSGADLDRFVFNGKCSLSVNYLLGLGLELLLKSAYVAYGGDSTVAHLKAVIGHDLKKAFTLASKQGLQSRDKALVDLVGYLNKPYQRHFRYGRPDGHQLPNNMEQVAAIYQSLYDEVQDLLKGQ